MNTDEGEAAALPPKRSAKQSTAVPMMLSHALRYAEIGLPVLPIAPGEKVPVLKAWQEGASTNPHTLRMWWKRHQQAGIGVHVGLAGLAVIDVDPRNGGLDTLHAIEAEHGPLWETNCLIARTAGGGTHFLFRAPENVDVPHSLGPGVDLLSRNRYFIVAPTIGPSGKAYAWEHGAGPFDEGALDRMPELPRWAWTAPEGDESRRSRHTTPAEPDDALAYIDPSIPDTAKERARLLAALRCVDPDCDRDTYLRLLMAIQSTGLHDAEKIAERWASGSLLGRVAQKFDGAFTSDWNSLDADGGVTVATLYGIAAKHGFETKRKAQTAIASEGVSIVCAADIKPEPIRWAWEGWLPFGKLTILAGEPGTGKTTIAMACAAIVSTGGKWPDGSRCPPGDVLVWSGEDDPRDTLVPRLLVAGADPKRVHFVGSTHDGLDVRPFDPARDMTPLQERAAEIGNIRMLIVDPIVSAVAGDSHKNAEVRRALAPLVAFAEASDAALLGISHFSKGTSGREPLERVTGSVAFGAVARVVWVAARIVEENGQVRRIVARAKSNIGPDDGGFAYSFDQVDLPTHPGINASKIDWGEALAGRARDLIATERNDPALSPKRGDATSWLEGALSAGPLPANELKEKAKAAGHAWRTVERSKAWLGVISKRSASGNRAPFVWALPEESPEGGDDDNEL